MPELRKTTDCLTASVETRLEVPFNYRVYFTRNSLTPGNALLSSIVAEADNGQPASVLVFIDSGLADARPTIKNEVKDYFTSYYSRLRLSAEPLLLPGGEDGKNSFEIPLKVIRLARQVHLDRHSYILAIGGGALLDSVGFAASMIHRGVRLLRMPTTVLSQNDSGVGVKNGVNLRGAKNFLGSFAPPYAVINDTSFLSTLKDRDWRSGISEAFKVAIIKDREFLDWLCAHVSRLHRRNTESMDFLIQRCAELHLEHIEENGDPFEFGNARPLDFGHWLAHKLESLTLHELNHGEAVAIGISLDLLYAAETGLIKRGEAMQVIKALTACGLPAWHEVLEATSPDGERLVYQGVEEFREHLGGQLCITLPNPLGKKTEISQIDTCILDKCLNQLRLLSR